MVALIKPQFEAGREQVGQKGIVRDPAIHEEVIHKVISYAEDSGFSVQGLDFSPITGTTGNIEFLIYLSLGGTPADIDIPVQDVVDAFIGARDARIKYMSCSVLWDLGLTDVFADYLRRVAEE